MDVKKYFDSIDHSILLALLEKRFKDPDLIWLFDQLIASYSVDNNCTKGVPIGNLSSQYFANYYLGVLDHYIKEKLQIKGYLRYMDDMVIFGNSRSSLLKQKNQIEAFVTSVLGVSLKQSDRTATKEGVPYCGFLIKPNGIFLLQRAKLRFRNRANHLFSLLKTDQISCDEYGKRIQSMISWTLIAKTLSFRRKVFSRIN